jgi:hypothetical protein
MIILHNPLDADSRAFVEQYGEGNTVLEYPDCVAQYPMIAAFPSVVYAVEGLPLSYVYRQPQTWQEIEDWVASIEIPIDDQLAAIEAKYEAKFAILRNRISTVMLADGADQESKLTNIQGEYATLCNQMNDEIILLLGGVE